MKPHKCCWWLQPSQHKWKTKKRKEGVDCVFKVEKSRKSAVPLYNTGLVWNSRSRCLESMALNTINICFISPLLSKLGKTELLMMHSGQSCGLWPWLLRPSFSLQLHQKQWHILFVKVRLLCTVHKQCVCYCSFRTDISEWSFLQCRIQKGVLDEMLLITL